MLDLYRSPSGSRLLGRFEEALLSADESWWTGRKALHTPVVAEVPCALYLNFIARKSYAARLKPDIFQPIELARGGDATLFTILLFGLERARPLWVPRIFGALSPRIMQSNWRFYGCLTEPGSSPKRSVLFVRTVTSSMALSAFGRRFARCFPLRRARQMVLTRTGAKVVALIDPGRGSAPGLIFEGEAAKFPDINAVFPGQFNSYQDYARFIVDQHLSVVIWPREYVVQDMHLDFQKAEIVPLRPMRCEISELQAFLPNGIEPFDCFLAENLRVYLDGIYARTEGGKQISVGSHGSQNAISGALRR